MKRMRGRNHRPGGGSAGGFRNQQNGIPLNRNHVFDSSGPEMRVRGTAQQLFDKYTQLARDAASSGDRVLGEAYYQHAEHYFRILSAINAAQGLPPPGQNGQGSERFGGANEPQRREANGEGETAQPREPRPEYRQENREARPEYRQERRFEQRPRQEFQPRDRQPDRQERPERGERPERQERPFRPSEPVADAPIDISAALEAELRNAIEDRPAGTGAQPETRDAPASEARAIPIASEAPPAGGNFTLTEPETPPPAPKRRGRPPRAKAKETEGAE